MHSCRAAESAISCSTNNITLSFFQFVSYCSCSNSRKPELEVKQFFHFYKFILSADAVIRYCHCHFVAIIQACKTNQMADWNKFIFRCILINQRFVRLFAWYPTIWYNYKVAKSLSPTIPAVSFAVGKQFTLNIMRIVCNSWAKGFGVGVFLFAVRYRVFCGDFCRILDDTESCHFLDITTYRQQRYQSFSARSTTLKNTFVLLRLDVIQGVVSCVMCMCIVFVPYEAWNFPFHFYLPLACAQFFLFIVHSHLRK